MAKINKLILLSAFLFFISPIFSATIGKNGIIYFYGYPFNTEVEINLIANIPSVLKGEISIEWKDVFIDKNHFDWSFIDKNIELWRKQGKTVILRFMTANNATYCTSAKLISEERIRLVGEGIFTDFEKDTKADGYEILNGKISNQNLSVAGSKLLELIDNKLVKSKLIQTTDKVKFVVNATYLVQFDYKILKFITKNSAGKFNLILQSKSNGNRIIESFNVKQGESSLFTKEIKCGSEADYQLSIEAEKIANCQIDNINIIQSSDSRGKRVAFPNYFSPAFKSSYVHFMQEAAKKYANNPTVSAITINGIGRWEEMLLNANEEGTPNVQKSFYRQWNAYGYTDVNYLRNVVEWSIDVSKKYFPSKEHILQISPMNNGYVNEDYIYRRAAAIAIAKGVSIKQNGMSEKYDTWVDTSDPAYVMNRYRHLKSPNRYYETGGQICRNTLNAAGHPISMFNRVAIDGVNYLYLYKADILEPNVQKYFPHFDSIIQNPCISKLYSKLGEFPLANQKKRKPNLLDTIMYHNNWIGIRQYNDIEANVDYVFDEKTQQKSVKTNATNYKILFDVDDRVMYNGMSNPVLTIEYLDAGTDKLNVSVLDRTTDKVMKVAEITKANSGNFQLKSIPLGTYFDAFDNRREVKPEIIIDDNKDGVEFISSMEIDFLPVNEFKMKVVSESKTTNKPLLFKNSNDIILREIQFTVAKPISKAEIIYCDSDFETKTDIFASLQLVENATSTQVSKKQYYIGGDKETILLPVASKIIPQKAILSAYWGNGKVGVYADNSGKMAYRLFCFENEEITDFEYNNDAFKTNQFFNGLELLTTVDPKNIEIHKVLKDKSEQKIEFSIAGNTVYFQPQTKGEYRVLSNNKSIKPVSICGLIQN